MAGTTASQKSSLRPVDPLVRPSSSRNSGKEQARPQVAQMPREALGVPVAGSQQAEVVDRARRPHDVGDVLVDEVLAQPAGGAQVAGEPEHVAGPALVELSTYLGALGVGLRRLFQRLDQWQAAGQELAQGVGVD